MRTTVAALTLAAVMVAFPLHSQALASTEFVAWPAQLSYGTPSGAVTWNSTLYGLRFDSGILPHLGFVTDLYFGSISNPNFGGGPLNGFSGQTLAGDAGLRLGGSLGRLDMAVFGGYEGIGLNATGPTAADRILLLTSGVDVGADLKLHVVRGLAIRGSFTYLPSLNSSANFSFSAPPSNAQFNGSGSGTEYEVDLSYSFIPQLSVFGGYRSASYQTMWSGSTSTTTTFSGYIFGLETRF